jgi:hypothetical protein
VTADRRPVQAAMFDLAQKHALSIMFVNAFPAFQAQVAEDEAKRGVLHKLSLSRSRTNSIEPGEADLVAVLNDKLRAKEFLKFCEGLHCQENVEFYLAVEKFRRIVLDGAEPISPRSESEGSEVDLEDFANRPGIGAPAPHRPRDVRVITPRRRGRLGAHRPAGPDQQRIAQALRRRRTCARALRHSREPSLMRGV